MKRKTRRNQPAPQTESGRLASGAAAVLPGLGKVYVANPGDYDWNDGAFLWTFGAYGSVRVVAFAGVNDLDSSFEEAAEFLGENFPGIFQPMGEDEYRDAAEELGYDFDDLTPDQETEVAEAAEVDLMYTEQGFIASWEAGVQELHGADYEALQSWAEAYAEEEENPPRRNITRRAHRQGAEAAGKMRAMAVQRQKRARARKDTRSATAAGDDRTYYEGAEYAHKRGAAGKRWPGPEEVGQEEIFIERLERESRGAENPPRGAPRDGKWHREIDPGNYALARDDGSIALVHKYSPRSKKVILRTNSKHAAAAYEHQTGQKLPRGTKWTARVFGRGGYGAGPPRWSTHKTFAAAKRAAVRGLKQ